jgi:hypothetical protein
MSQQRALALIWLMSLSGTTAPAWGQPLELREGYYLYLGDYPSNSKPDWVEDVQGVAHDANNWFITNTWRVQKIPVTGDLDSSPGPGYIDRYLWHCQGVFCSTDMPALYNDGYSHIGDPDYYQVGAQGYLLAPVEGGPSPGIAAFDTSDLSYIDHAYMPGAGGAAWCAVDRGGSLYTSQFTDVTAIMRWAVDWTTLRDSGTLVMLNPTPLDLLDATGALTTLQHVQGGAFSPSGQRLYLVADDLHVFDMVTRRQVQVSSNGSGIFNFQFHPGDGEEPEGIAFWDLDDGRAPNLSGQLHVLLLVNSFFGDAIYFKHYTATIRVDGAYAGPQDGTPARPFMTVGAANAVAWDGSILRVRAGSYPETLSFSRVMTVQADGGPVTIGQLAP